MFVANRLCNTPRETTKGKARLTDQMVFPEPNTFTHLQTGDQEGPRIFGVVMLGGYMKFIKGT